MGRGGRSRRSAAGKAYWSKLSAEKRGELRRRQADESAQHHYRDDLACPPCGTDSSVGCLKGDPRG